MDICEGNDDREDFERFLVEYGFSKEWLQSIVENEADMLPMPEGFDAVRLGDSLIQGKGLFATRAVEAGEVLAPARLEKKRTPAGRFTNHAMDPNAIIRPRAMHEQFGDCDLVADRAISIGEEVTVDYRQVGSINGHGFKPNLEAVAATMKMRLARAKVLGSSSRNMSEGEVEQWATRFLETVGYLPAAFGSSGNYSEYV